MSGHLFIRSYGNEIDLIRTGYSKYHPSNATEYPPIPTGDDDQSRLSSILSYSYFL